jgi:hypothetical protein
MTILERKPVIKLCLWITMILTFFIVVAGTCGTPSNHVQVVDYIINPGFRGQLRIPHSSGGDFHEHIKIVVGRDGSVTFPNGPPLASCQSRIGSVRETSGRSMPVIYEPGGQPNERAFRPTNSFIDGNAIDYVGTFADLK